MGGTTSKKVLLALAKEAIKLPIRSSDWAYTRRYEYEEELGDFLDACDPWTIKFLVEEMMNEKV